MHLEKFQVDKIQNGRLSAIIHLDRPDIVEYHENRSRYLHHYYKTNCKVSGEDAFWKKSTCPSSKWPPIGHDSLSQGRYLVNRARWQGHYYKTKCVISGEDASWKKCLSCFLIESGFCSSYKETTRYEQNAALNQGTVSRAMSRSLYNISQIMSTTPLGH